MSRRRRERDERMQGLLKRIEDYETYFEGKEKSEAKLDHQATTAYMNLVKLVLGLRGEEESASGKGPEELRAMARKILREVYGARA